MTKPGLRKLRCEVCGTEREVEAGIRSLFCCAQEMVEAVEEEEAETKGQGPTLRIKPRE